MMRDQLRKPKVYKYLLSMHNWRASLFLHWFLCSSYVRINRNKKQQRHQRFYKFVPSVWKERQENIIKPNTKQRNVLCIINSFFSPFCCYFSFLLSFFLSLSLNLSSAVWYYCGKCAHLDPKSKFIKRSVWAFAQVLFVRFTNDHSKMSINYIWPFNNVNFCLNLWK